MIESIIRWSVANRFFVLLASAILVGAGLFSLKNTPIDALPDLSDVQVIIKTSYPGQAPQVVEDQVTYPISTSMKKPIYIGLVVVCWSTSVKSFQRYRIMQNLN